MKTDIVNKLRMYAEDLHSAGGFNGYASAMSLAADEIDRLREAAKAAEADTAWRAEFDAARAELAATKRVASMMTKAAADHAETVVALRAVIAEHDKKCRCTWFATFPLPAAANAAPDSVTDGDQND